MSTLSLSFSYNFRSTTSAAVTATSTRSLGSTRLLTSTGSLTSTRSLSSTTEVSSVQGITSDTSSPPTGPATGPAPSFTGAGPPTPGTSGLSASQTIGIVVGVVIGTCLLMCSIALFCWKRRRQRLQQKPSAKRDVDQQPSSSRPKSQPRHTRSKRYSLDRPVTKRHSNTWPRNVNLEESRGAVRSGQRQSILSKLTSPKSKPRSILPISAPIPQDRVSIQGGFQDRFFAQPTPVSEDNPHKHISDATTIRTSCNLPTPGDPSITVLRPMSTSTSIATSFEEDREYQPDDVPPVPRLSTIADLPIRSVAERRSREGPGRINVEAGIVRNISKATSHVPMTPKYDNGYGSTSAKSAMPIIPRSRLKSSKSVDDARSRNSTPQTPNPLSRPDLPSMRTKLPPIPHSPQSPFVIPERDSSLRNVNLQTDEQWLLEDSGIESDSHGRSQALRPPPLVVRKQPSQPVMSPIQSLKYPRVPFSTSESDLSYTSPGAQSPFTPRSTSRSHLHNDRYATKPLPPIAHPSDLMEDLSGSGYVIKDMQSPSRPSRINTITSSGQGRLQIHSSSNRAPSKAIFTPNRTNTGDLVLTVNM